MSKSSNNRVILGLVALGLGCAGIQGMCNGSQPEAPETVLAPAPQAEVQAQVPEQQATIQGRPAPPPAPSMPQGPEQVADEDMQLYMAVWEYEGDHPGKDGFNAVAKESGVDRQAVFDASMRVSAHHEWLQAKSKHALYLGLKSESVETAAVMPTELGNTTLAMMVTVTGCSGSHEATRMLQKVAALLQPVAVDSYQAQVWRDGCGQDKKLGRATWTRADNSIKTYWLE